jgi:hypothetical protein
MEKSMPKIITAFILCITFCLASAHADEGHITIIKLTQTGCQFLEPEDKDHQFKTQQASDCEQINDETAKARIASSTPLTLKPGKHVFRITNKNVPYALGFWLRGKGIKRAILPSVSGGGLETGNTLDYEITLKPGEYLYSCPLNPTPNYALIVK